MIGYGDVVVPDGCAEDACAVVVVCPCDDCLAVALHAASNDFGVREHLHVVVKFLPLSRPVFDALGDERYVFLKLNFNRLLRAVAGGLQADVLEPPSVFGTRLDRFAEVAGAVRVHGTVEVDAGDTLAMRREHAGDGVRVADPGRAFVVDDDVVALGIVRFSKNRQRRFGAFVVGMRLIDDDVDPPLEALLEGILLLGVIVATAAGDQQRTQRLVCGV